jgi:hypothetical protein
MPNGCSARCLTAAERAENGRWWRKSDIAETDAAESKPRPFLMTEFFF